MLSYDSPMPANKGHKDTVNALAAASAAATTSSPSSASNGLAINGTSISNYKHHHIWLVTGPAGCGKSTVAEFISSKLHMPYIEGDAYHTDANVEKMRTGTPLTDEDRWDWLTALREESVRRISTGSSGVVLTCSALKRKYRDVIRVASYFDHTVLIHFIFLDASEEVLLERVARRQNHYMGADMVHSQFDILERPSKDEKDVVAVDVSRTIEEVKEDALSKVLATMRVDLE